MRGNRLQPSSRRPLLEFAVSATFVFVLLVALGAAAAHHGGRPEWGKKLGAAAVIGIGAFFVLGMVSNAVQYGQAWVAYFGRVSRTHRPRIYWATWSVPFLLGIVVMGLGVWLLITQ